MEHEIIQSGEIHVPHNWKFANQAARFAAVITDSSQLDKLALQASDGTYWRLTGVNPAVWVAAIGPKGDGFKIDASGPFSERGAYDNEPMGFTYLATDTGLIYFKNSAASGDWSDGVQFAGQGVAPGGSTEQTLVKNSTADYDTKWVSIPAPVQAALDTKQASLSDVTQIEAETGTSTVGRIWSALRVRQAIVAWGATLTKASVGLGNVDNTSDTAKPISTATQTALNNKVDKEAGKGLSTNDFTDDAEERLSELKPILPGTNVTFDEATTPGSIIINATGGGGTGDVQSVNGVGPDGAGNVQLVKGDIGLGNVDNTSDANKPISTATQTALNNKEPVIATGTTAQYITGAKTLVDFATSVRAAVLTGLSTATSTVVAATDTVLQAIGKLQAQVSLRALSGLITGSGLTMATGKLLGRSTASTGAVEEITIGSNLALTSGVLSATGGAIGPGTQKFFLGNDNGPMTGDFTLPTGQNFVVVGKYTVANGSKLTVPDGTRLVVL